MRTSSISLVLLALASSCASTQRAVTDPLPFSVALLPVEARQESQRTEEAPGKATEISLTLTPDEVSDQLAEELRSRCFARSVVLSPLSEGVHMEDSDWLSEANRHGVDLVLHVSVTYDPVVYTSTNDLFWLNFPLFALGGPMCWFVDDRSYYVDAEMNVEIFDINSFRRVQEASFRQRESILASRKKLEEVPMDFVTRAGGSIGSYALSMLMPAGFLASESEAVKSKLGAMVVQRLGDQVVQTLQDRASELASSAQVAGFRVPVLEVVGERLRGEVVVDKSPAFQKMSAIYMGPEGSDLAQLEPMYLSLEDAEEDSERITYRLDCPVPTELLSSVLRVFLEDEAGSLRSFNIDTARPVAAGFRRQQN